MKYKKRSLLCACAQGGFSMITNIHELGIGDFEKLLKENLQKSVSIMGFDLYKKLLKHQLLEDSDITIIVTDEAIEVKETKGNTFVTRNIWEALYIAESDTKEQILFLYDEELLPLAIKNIVFETLQICFVQGKSQQEFSVSEDLPIVHLSDYSEKDVLYKINETNMYGFYIRTYTLEP